MHMPYIYAYLCCLFNMRLCGCRCLIRACGSNSSGQCRDECDECVNCTRIHRMPALIMLASVYKWQHLRPPRPPSCQSCKIIGIKYTRPVSDSWQKLRQGPLKILRTQ